ncbi:MAG: hypothetical protein AAF409_00275 [Pseudomonadota bacterium]
MLRTLTLALSLAIAAPAAAAAAAQLEPATRFADADAGFALSRVEQAIELVRATRDIPLAAYPDMQFPSDLRVSLLVLDNGPATDVSPRLDLQIAMFNEVLEYGTAWALEPVASVYALSGVSRTAPGIYEARAVVLSGTDGPECYFQNATIRIDARALSVAVRNAAGLEEFDARRYTADVPLSITAEGCAESPF